MNTLHTNQRAFLLPSILIMIAVIGLVGIVTLSVARTSFTNTVRNSYDNIARVASKGALDYAKESFDSDALYAGTTETDILSTGQYRVTMEIEVLNTSSDGFEKEIRGIGRVYIPEISVSTEFVRDIKTTVIRRGVTGNPTDFNPVLWLDAADDDTVLTGTVTTAFETIAASSTLEEKNNGSQTTAQWNSDDLEMPKKGEQGGNQRVGIVFPDVDIPNSATVTNAYIQFTTDETKNNKDTTLRIRAVDQDDAAAFSPPPTANQLRNAATTAAEVLWSPNAWGTVGASGTDQQTPDLTSIVQEVVDRTGWNSGNDIAFHIQRSVGGGTRTAQKNNGLTLYVEWETGTGSTSTAGDGDDVIQWNDKSGNGNNAVQAFGAAPTKENNELNGSGVVRFNNNGNLVSSLNSVITDANEATAFMVLKPNTASSTNGRYLTMQNSVENSDDVADGLIILRKSSSTTDIEQRHNGSSGALASAAIDGSFSVYTSLFGSDGVSLIRKDKNETTATVAPFYSVDQIYIGGSRSASSGANYIDGDIAEIIVYDQALTCLQVESIEDYLGPKWGLTLPSETCPDLPIGF